MQAKNILVNDGGALNESETPCGPENHRAWFTMMAQQKDSVLFCASEGINTERMLAEDMHIVLSNHDDFTNEQTIAEHYMKNREHLVFFLPTNRMQ